MRKDKSTITGGLGIESSFVESSKGIIVDALQSEEYVSDTLLKIANTIREDVLGDTGSTKLSVYEIKLILIGFMTGEMRAHANHVEQLNMLKRFGDFLGKMNDDCGCE